MLDKIKYAARLSGVGVFSFAKYFVLGNLSVFFSFLLGMFIVIVDIHEKENTSNSGVDGVLAFLGRAPVQFVLLLLILVSVYFITTLASAYAIKKVISKLLQDKAESVLYPMIEKVIDKVKQNKPGALVNDKINASVYKLHLLQVTKQQHEKKWIKRVVAYVFKKSKLTTLTFQANRLMYTI